MAVVKSKVSGVVAGIVAGLLATGGLIGLGTQPANAPQEPGAPAAKVDAQVLAFTIPDVDGKDVDLSKFKGQVVMIVNSASKCGFTKQYKDLEALYQANKEKGFVVLAFPSGDFGKQEFADNAAIKEFCTGAESKYKVTFPLFGKMSVKGEEAHPLFKKLAGQAAPVGGEPKWNFTKWLVDREGNVVERFDFRVSPTSEEVTTRVAALIAAKAPAGTTPTVTTPAAPEEKKAEQKEKK